MLRRRILASAMASVMALSSVAVVASAGEETAVTNVKSRTDLKDYVATFDSIREKDVFESGSISAQRLLDALEYADNVLADSDATAKDFTAAYLMVAALANMDSYTNSQLSDLINTWKGTYDKQNVMNLDLGDVIYTTDSYYDFQVAYENAQLFETSDDARNVTDAYILLSEKAAGLKRKDSVKKSEFRAALKAYEACLLELENYDLWRRGTMASSGDTGWNELWCEFSEVKDLIQGDAKINGFKTSDNTAYTVDALGEFGIATTDVQAYIKGIYDEFDGYKSANVTSADQIVNAYKACQKVTRMFKAWTADNTTRANKATVEAILKKYHNQLVADFRQTTAEDLYKDVCEVTTVPAGWISVQGGKITGAALNNDYKDSTGKAAIIAVPVDANGFYTTGTAAKTVNVSPKQDLLRFVQVTSDDVTDAELNNAMWIAEQYLAGNFDKTDPQDVYGLDQTNAVKKGTGSVTEWTLIYRKLLYVLGDRYPAATTSNITLKMLQDKIDEAYELCEKTGDAAIFNENNEHINVVKFRQAAIEAVRDKKQDSTYVIDQFYKDLEGAVKALADKLAVYPYSYGEVQETIYKVAADLDAGEYNDAKVVELLSKVAKDLSIVEANAVHGDNDAFTSDRVFQPVNRVHVHPDWQWDCKGSTASEKALKEDYEALLKAVEEAKAKAEVLLGDVNKDGAVNILDAVAIAEAGISNTTIDVAVGDFNQDGTVNVFDAVAIAESRIS